MFEMSQPVDWLSVWGKKQRGKVRESGGGGGGGRFSFSPVPRSTKGSQARNVTKHRLVLDIYSSPLTPTTPRGFLEVVVFKNTILQMGC